MHLLHRVNSRHQDVRITFSSIRLTTDPEYSTADMKSKQTTQENIKGLNITESHSKSALYLDLSALRPA